MAKPFIEMEVEPREITGKKGRRDAAAREMIPGVVYGGGKNPVPISVDPRTIIQVLRSEKGMNSILLFSLKGTKAQRHVMIKDFQVDPTTNTLIHADFTRIMMDQKIRVYVPLAFDGVAAGVKTQGGIVDIIVRELEVECLPNDVPDRIHADLTPLMIGDSVKLGDLQVPDGVQVLAEDKSQPVVLVEAPRVEVEEEEAEEAEAEAGEEEAEPEVISRGKKPEDQEEEEE
ncbi:MAG: 50S ribosomal protein L25 [Acidobacteriota bacterium]|jgi:large subunit ribosomal protein L25